MSIQQNINRIDDEFPDCPDRRLSDNYHRTKLRLAEEILLTKAESGDILAIQTLLKLVSEALNDGARINKKIANFVSKALIQIYKGEKADLAFGITRVRGQKDTRISRQKNFSIAFFIEEAELGSLEDKFQKAAIEFHVSFDTAKKAWQKNYHEARRIVELNKKNFSR
jgi:hypothetical protein